MTEVYGPGAFLLAGTEMYRMAEDAPKQNATIPQNRIQEIAAMLPDRPQGIGTSYKDRTFWNKDKRCENCISLKALEEKKQTSKIEFLDSDMYQVFARYLEIDSEPYVMENAEKSWTRTR